MTKPRTHADDADLCKAVYSGELCGEELNKELKMFFMANGYKDKDELTPEQQKLVEFYHERFYGMTDPWEKVELTEEEARDLNEWLKGCTSLMLKLAEGSKQ